mgnify:CR=1 FL=1
MLIAGLALFNLLVTLVEKLIGTNALLVELLQSVPVAELAKIKPLHGALIAGISYAFIKTSGSEELLFRGLLYKSLLRRLDTLSANLIQALVFTLIHNLVVEAAMPDAPLWLHGDIFIRVFVLSLAMGWFMAKKDEGSIFSAWLCHGVTNFLTFLGFLLL